MAVKAVAGARGLGDEELGLHPMQTRRNEPRDKPRAANLLVIVVI